MEKARFWASLKMSQYVSDLTPSALGILRLGIQIILKAGKSTVGLVKRSLLAMPGVWLQTKQHLCSCISHQGSPQICCRRASGNPIKREKF
jgi:hypothetical protein